MAEIPEGYGIIAGRSRATAQAALDAAVAAGVPISEIRAVNEGYVVPLSVLDAYTGVGDDEETAAAAVPAADVADVPNPEWRNTDIRAWAEEHQVDLADATKKADMLAAIAAAGSQ